MPENDAQIASGNGDPATTCGSSSALGCSALTDGLIDAVLDCEQERLSAQMSGFETGWEHPNSQALWVRVITIAKLIRKPNPSRLGAAHLVRGTQHGVVGGPNS